jgi:hypothetical protein
MKTSSIWGFPFSILWGRWTRGLSQIWLLVTEKSRHFLKPCYVLVTCKNLCSKKNMAISRLFYLEIWRIWGTFSPKILWRSLSPFPLFLCVAKWRNCHPKKRWVSWDEISATLKIGIICPSNPFRLVIRSTG